MGLFDDLIPSDKPDLGAFADLVPKPRNFAAVANDTAIEIANAAAGAVSAGANFISPGNRVSQYIDKNIVEAGEEAQSDVAKAAKRKFRGEVEAADGLTGELAAVGRHIVNAPLLTAAQAAGSFALPGLAVKGGGILAGGERVARASAAGAARVANAGLAGGATAGAALAGGDAAGQAYQLARDAGATEEQAVAAGRQASVLPAIVGGAGGLVGAERLLAGAGGVKGGILARALKTGAIEATQEGFEEGLTQFEGQRAAMPYDPSIDPWKGVGAAAGMGAAMGGGVGAVTGAATREPEKPITEGVDKIVGAQSVDEAIAAAAQAVSGKPVAPTPAERVSAVMASVDMDAVRAQYGNEAATEFLTSLAQVQNPRVPRSVREQHLRLLESTAAALRETPASMPIGEAAELLPTGDAAEIQYEAIPTGEATDMLPVGDVSEESPVLPTGEAAELDAETIDAAAPPPVNWQVATRDTATLRDRLEAYRKKPDAAAPPIQPPAPVAEQPGAGRAPDLERGVAVLPGVEADAGRGIPAPATAPVGGGREAFLIRGSPKPDETLKSVRSAASDRTTQTGNAKPASFKSGKNGVRTDAEGFANLAQSTAFREQGFRGLDVPGQRVVLAHVVARLHDREILRRVVHLVPVDMVHNLAGKKGPAESLLRDDAVLVRLSTINNNDPVAVTDAASALVRAVASVAAEQEPVTDLGGDATETDAALGADEQRPVSLVNPVAGGTAKLVRPVTSEVSGTARKNDSTLGAGKIDDRHVVTPNSDGVLGTVGGETPSVPPIVAAPAPFAELGTDLPTLKRQWQDAVRAGDGDLAKRVNAQIVAVKSGDVMPHGLRVTFGGKTYPVESIRDAQEKWEAFRDQTGAGASEVGNGVRITDGAGRFVARISYNGRAWDDEDGSIDGGNLIAESPNGRPAKVTPEEARAWAAEAAPAPASWVIREKATGKVVMETFDKAKVDALNTAKYEAVPIQEYLASLNRKPAEAQPQADEPLPAFKPYADMTADEKAAFDARTGDSPAKRAETAAKLDAIAKATEANRREAPNTTKPAKQTTNRPPKSFRKKHIVQADVFVEESAKMEKREVDADTALKALDEDISELEAFLKCIKG